MAKYPGNINVKPFNVVLAQPADVRTVVDYISDLKDMTFMKSIYAGIVVYVVEDSSLYVCFNKPKTNKLTNVEDGWKKIDIDYSVRIVESESNLTDGVTIMFPFQGMMAYVTSESSLYVLLTKGVDKAKDINNWRKISSSTQKSVDKVGIEVEPEGGSGFKISGNKDVIVDSYVNAENYIKSRYFYTSNGVNSYNTNPNFTYDSVRLSKDGESYIELYATGDNWMKINEPDGLGLSVTVDGVDYVSGELIAKETFVCFGSDIQFIDGWIISYGDESRAFVESDYELIDIYRREYSPEVYAYLKNIDVRVLTEDDLMIIDDKIDNLPHSIMIDLDEDSSDVGESDNMEPVSLQKVIVNMNNSINKLEQTTKVEPETIEYSEIVQLFS